VSIETAVIDRIILNGTSHHSITLAGSVTVDGKCSGTQYADGYDTWMNAIVSVKIILRQFEVNVRHSTGVILLPSGTRCDVQVGSCRDVEGGETYWSPLPADNCHFNRYDVLYEGIATRLTPKENTNQTNLVIYTVTTEDTTFALARTTSTNLCGYNLYSTEYPKLLILETQRGKTFKARTKIAVDNLDIFSYVNSKFVYVEKHVKT
jgi:hypothetical protein